MPHVQQIYEGKAVHQRYRRFDRIVSVSYWCMYRYAAYLSGNPSIAEDVVQESMVRAWKSLDALRDDAASKAWLRTIVRRENARYFARKRLKTVDIDNLSRAQSAMLVETDDARIDELRHAIDKLDENYREPLVLQVLMGHSTKEIARLMGIKQRTVLSRLYRARNKLRHLVDCSGTAAVG